MQKTGQWFCFVNWLLLQKFHLWVGEFLRGGEVYVHHRVWHVRHTRSEPARAENADSQPKPEKAGDRIAEEAEHGKPEHEWPLVGLHDQ